MERRGAVALALLGVLHEEADDQVGTLVVRGAWLDGTGARPARRCMLGVGKNSKLASRVGSFRAWLDSTWAY